MTVSKYKNEWDVTVRNTGTIETTSTVRVKGSWHRLDGGYLLFELPAEDPKDLQDFIVTALFPHQSVSKVVRVEEEPTVETLTDELVEVTPEPLQAAQIFDKDHGGCCGRTK